MVICATTSHPNMTRNEFPRFNKIDIDWQTLNTIVKDNVSS